MTTITANVSKKKDIKTLTALMNRLGIDYKVEGTVKEDVRQLDNRSIVDFSNEELKLKLEPAFDEIKARRLRAGKL